MNPPSREGGRQRAVQLFLHCGFGFEVELVAGDRGLGHGSTVPFVGHGTVATGGITVQFQAIPFFGMADVVHGHVIVLALEVRHGRIWFPVAQHVACGSLSLTLGHGPVFDANGRTASAIGPAGQVSRGPPDPGQGPPVAQAWWRAARRRR